MNNFYISAGPNLRKQFPNIWRETDFKIDKECAFDFDFITEKEVKELVKNIDLSKSSTFGNLGTRLLRDALKCLTLELTYIYNMYRNL